MHSSRNKVGRQLAYVGLTTLVFVALNGLNDFVFNQFEYSNGISWVFLPAGIRLLSTLLFGFAGFAGLLLAGIYLNFHYFVFHDDVRAWSGAVAGAAGPYLAYLYAKHWFNLGPRLKNLTARGLLLTGVLCALMSPFFHHAFMWVQTGRVDWTGFIAMSTGDLVGILVVLYLAKGLITLTDPHDVEDYSA